MAGPMAVSDTLGADVGRNIQPTFGYYRQPNGWVTISPNTRLERLKYSEEGWTYLEQYGAFDMTAYTVNHPFEALFMFGGAAELPAEQVLQTGLYIDPPLVPTCFQHTTQYHRGHRAACWRGAKPVAFPQLADVPAALIGPFICSFCQRKMATVASLTQHQSVAHVTPMGNIQLGKTLGDTIAAAMSKQPTAAELDELAALRIEVARAKKQPKLAVSS